MANSISRRQFDSLCASLCPQEQMEVRGNLDNSRRLYSKSGGEICVYSRSRDSWSTVRRPSSREVTPPPELPMPVRSSSAVSHSRQSTRERRVVRLPSREKMERALLKVNDSSHIQEKMYPRLLQGAGQERYPSGVVTMLIQELHDYTEKLPPFMAQLMMEQEDDFLKALIPDDTAALQEARQFLSSVRSG